MGGWGGIWLHHSVQDRNRTLEFRAAQEDPVSHIEIHINDGETTLLLEESQAVHPIVESLKEGVFFNPNHPLKEQKLYMRVYRRNMRIDEFEIFLDRRGGAYDYVSTVHKSGTKTWYFGNFKTSQIRESLQPYLSNPH